MFQVNADSQYQIVTTAELQPSAEDISEEKQTMELITQFEKPTLASENAMTKGFDVVTDCSDHHFVKEIGHENVMVYLVQLSFFIFLANCNAY